MKLCFAKKNEKLEKLAKAIGGKVVSFNLRAGWTCPGADICKSCMVYKHGKPTIQDGPNTLFRCFAASHEARLSNVAKSRLQNEAILEIAKKSVNQAANIINQKLPKGIKAVRIHSSGDFKFAKYFLAWIKVAQMNPNIIFYGYTKMIPFLIKYKDKIDATPNFRIVASVGGKYDHLITKEMTTATVVMNEFEAKRLRLPIDTNDYMAYTCSKSFALLIHGIQPKGSEAAIHWEKIRREKIKNNKNHQK